MRTQELFASRFVLFLSLVSELIYNDRLEPHSIVPFISVPDLSFSSIYIPTYLPTYLPTP